MTSDRLQGKVAIVTGADSQPLGLGRPEQVAAGIVFLASEPGEDAQRRAARI